MWDLQARLHIHSKSKLNMYEVFFVMSGWIDSKYCFRYCIYLKTLFFCQATVLQKKMYKNVEYQIIISRSFWWCCTIVHQVETSGIVCLYYLDFSQYNKIFKTISATHFRLFHLNFCVGFFGSIGGMQYIHTFQLYCLNFCDKACFKKPFSQKERHGS